MGHTQIASILQNSRQTLDLSVFSLRFHLSTFVKIKTKMALSIYQVDAFTSQLFGGNPAAVIPLETWLPDATLQAIAEENNLSETAFFVPSENEYHLRWFTPVAEVDLCGHATLATAHVLWNHLHYSGESVYFRSRSGPLTARKNSRWYTLDFPADKLEETLPPGPLVHALNTEIQACFKGREDFLVLLNDEDSILGLQPDFASLRKLEGRGVICTAAGNDADFVSRCFFPVYGIDEDPVTGSAHTTLTPFWAKRLGKTKLSARQLSKRGGTLVCELHGNRTLISGQAVTYLIGELLL